MYTVQAPKSKALQDLYSVVESYPLHFLPQTGQRDLCHFVISTRIYREDETLSNSALIILIQLTLRMDFSNFLSAIWYSFLGLVA